MKRRCVPLRADHNLLTPDTHTLSGVRLHPLVQVRSEVVASLSGHLSDLSSSRPPLGSTRRRTPVASPTRRLRFEDETEIEAESRYLERQRRRAGQRGTGVLVSKPNLKLYDNGRAGAVPQGAGVQGVQHVVDGEQRGQMLPGGTDQSYSLGKVLGDRVKLNVHLHPPVPEDRGRSLHRSHLNFRTETIRETYIGSVTPGENSRGVGNDQYVANKHVRGMMNEVELNGNQVNLTQATPTADTPINPYAPTQPSDLATPISKGASFVCLPSSMMSRSIRLNVTKSEKSLSQSQEEQERPATSKPHREIQSGGEVNERSPCVEEKGVELTIKNTSLFSSTSVRKAESPAPPTSDSNDEGQVRQPLRAELHSNDTSLPEPFMRRDASSRLSLRRLLSTVRLSRTRTGSLDRLSSQPRPPTPDSAPSCPRKSSGLLKKTLAVQALSVGSPFLQLRKSSSVQTVVSEQKKDKDRSADYKPAADQRRETHRGRPCVCLSSCLSLTSFPSFSLSVCLLLSASQVAATLSKS
ncbi:uncharacterized protein LOC119029096 isoform X2 [Acanthopagrus latus]|uniref:uncharacterized protein LOC119029096 isoform X2 n=1 Tax=Acanthopagrus latus TaxID=8177 RepID=UPI00187BE459|nr:uncharacterized protein LOC119029096 isoform X2 [Acanthopagrus latus]